MQITQQIMQRFLKELRPLIARWWTTYYSLMKIMLPAIVVVYILQQFGLSQIFAQWSAPLMASIGLPAELSLVWMAGIFANIYTAGSVLIALNSELSLTLAQATTLSFLILGAHSMIMEQSIVRQTGCRVLASLLFRVGMAYVLAWVVFQFYRVTGLSSSQKAHIWWKQSSSNDGTFLSWLISSAQTIVNIALILFALIVLLHIFNLIGGNRLLEKILAPLFVPLGISPKAADITAIGFLMGLSYGGGLLMSEVKRGHLSSRSVFMSMSLLMLMHSIIEDVLLMVSFGADWKMLFLFRPPLAFLVLWLWHFVIKALPDSLFYHLFYKKRDLST